MGVKVGVGFGVLVVFDDRILLGKRHEDPLKADSLLNGAGTWTMPGGKLEFGESFEDGACREVLEETGLKIDKCSLRLISVANDIVETAHFVTVGMYCSSFEGEPKVMEPDEITKWDWFRFDDLPSPLFFPSQKVLDNYMAGKIYSLQR
ncbi:MAG: NUDIX domain-containing protein [Verrucomicrobia bacterium]|nr:NUDIX domain-containing protein [Verrucomicrobiota bacterium]